MLAIRPAIGNQNAAEPERQGLGKKNTTCVLNRQTYKFKWEGRWRFFLFNRRQGLKNESRRPCRPIEHNLPWRWLYKRAKIYLKK